MSDTDEQAVKLVELLLDVSGQVDPADDAENERRGQRDGKQFSGFVEVVPSLDYNGADHAVLVEQRLKIFGTVAPSQWSHVFSHPGVVGCGRVPEVLV